MIGRAFDLQNLKTYVLPALAGNNKGRKTNTHTCMAIAKTYTGTFISDFLFHVRKWRTNLKDSSFYNFTFLADYYRNIHNGDIVCLRRHLPIPYFTRRCQNFTLAPFIILNSGWAGKQDSVENKEKSMDACVKAVHFLFRQFLCLRTPFEQRRVPFPPTYHWKI